MIKVDHCSRFKVDGKYGLKSKRFSVVFIEPQYDDIRRIKNSLYFLKVKKNNKWGVVNCLGAIILKFLYDDICYFDGKRFTVITNRNIYYIEPNKKPIQSKQGRNFNRDKYSGWKKGELDWSRHISGRVEPTNMPYSQTKSGFFAKKNN